MAIQNFLSGGYYGKLGDTVGQRWHNKRTIRSYVIPANPQTPKQQANRYLFATSTRLAQIAFQVNRGSPLWDTSSMGQFPQLVSLAKRRLQAGMSETESIPWYPDGYTPNLVLQNVTADYSDWQTSVTFSDTSYIFTEKRTFECEIRAFNEIIQRWEIVTFTAEISAGNSFSATWVNQSLYSLPPSSSFTAASSDDEEHNNSSIYVPPVDILQPSRPIINAYLSFENPQMIDPNFWLIQVIGTVENEQEYAIPVQIYCYSTYDSEWTIWDTEILHDTDNTARIGIDMENDYTFPPGSYIIQGSDQQPGTWADYEFSWVRFVFTIP